MGRMRHGGSFGFRSRSTTGRRAGTAVLFALVAAVAAFSSEASARRPEVPDDRVPAACRSTNAVVIENGFLVSDGDRGPTRTTVDLTGRELEPGRYRVTLHSFDFHDDGDGPQLNEQWRIELSAGGATLYRSSPTDELADDASTIATVVEPDAALEVAADTLTAIHAFEGVPGDGKADSIYALCAVFDPVEEPPTLALTHTVDADGDGVFADSDNRAEGLAGPATFSVSIDNRGTTAETIVTLEADRFGDLHGVGTCAVPQTISAGGSYSCTFARDLAGENAGTAHRNTVTATPAAGEPVADEATVNFGDVTPSVTVTKSAVAAVAAPAALVDFRVVITNASSPTDPITVRSVVDDQFGSLLAPLGAGVESSSCTAVVIDADSSHECTFRARVGGDAGDQFRSTVTATVADDEGNSATATADHVISFDPIPTKFTVLLTDDETAVRPTVDGSYNYTVEVFNLLDTPLPPLTLTVALPPGITAPTGVAGNACATPLGGEVRISFEGIAGGRSTSCSFPVQADLVFAQVVVARVCVDGTDVCEGEPTRLLPSPDVLGTSETVPATSVAPPTGAAPTLAVTGPEPGFLAALGALLLAVGALLLHTGRRASTPAVTSPRGDRSG